MSFREYSDLPQSHLDHLEEFEYPSAVIIASRAKLLFKVSCGFSRLFGDSRDLSEEYRDISESLQAFQGVWWLCAEAHDIQLTTSPPFT